jgi:hypothetical protein
MAVEHTLLVGGWLHSYITWLGVYLTKKLGHELISRFTWENKKNRYYKLLFPYLGPKE